MEINYTTKKKKYLNLYNKYGFVLIRSLFEKHDIEKIKIELMKYSNSVLNKVSKRQINFVSKSKMVNSLHDLKNCKIINKLKKHKKIKLLARDFVGENVREYGAEFFAKPKKNGMPSPVHQDNYYWNLNNNNGITIWIALNKSGYSNGGIFYYLKSHKIGIQPHKPSNAPGSSQMIAHENILSFFKKQTPTLNIGDAIIHHSAVIHGSKKNLSNNSRMALTLRFIPKKSKIDIYLKKKYEKELKKQVYK